MSYAHNLCLKKLLKEKTRKKEKGKKSPHGRARGTGGGFAVEDADICGTTLVFLASRIS
jgi:hypothetical protein